MLLNLTTFWFLVSDRFTSFKQKYDLKVQEAELVKARLEQGSHHQQLEEIQSLQKSIGKVHFRGAVLLGTESD